MIWVGAITVTIISILIIMEQKYKRLEAEVLNELGFYDWNIISYYDEYVTVKSRQALEEYDDVKFFKENKEKLAQVEKSIEKK